MPNMRLWYCHLCRDGPNNIELIPACLNCQHRPCPQCQYETRKDPLYLPAVLRSPTGLKRSREAFEIPSLDAPTTSARATSLSASGQPGERTHTRDVFKTSTTIQDRVKNLSGFGGPGVEIPTPDTANARLEVHGQTVVYTSTSDDDPMRVGFQSADLLKNFANKL